MQARLQTSRRGLATHAERQAECGNTHACLIQSEFWAMNYRELFPVIDRHTWLNHAAISPWPAPVGVAMRGFVDENIAQGPLGYAKWLDTEQSLKKRAE